MSSASPRRSTSGPPPKGKWLWSQCRREKVVGDRLVYANDPARNAEQQFPDNRITNTKYTPLTFIPLNLLEQFRRNINRYFLLIACLQLIAEITPVNPLTTWVPLFVIFGITAVKELVDDLGRRRSDKMANGREYQVVRNGKRTTIPAHDIHVGDMVYLVENEELPCDVVVISCSDPKGNCFIQTTNLDGESNLKPRSALPETKDLITDRAIGAFKGVIKCGAPDEKIYTFDSQLRTSTNASRVLSLSSDQLLLQATHLRNTDFVYGVAVYTGNETKFGNNKKVPPPKLTKTDKLIDNFSGIIFIFQLVLVLIFGIIGNVWKSANGKDSWYLGYPDDEPDYQFLIIPARFLLLNSTMIPISLKVTLDLCKLFYAKFINRDPDLYDAATDTPAHSNSTALSEDLGQIQYVLTDKTGTLTENVMILKVCTVGGTQYGKHDPNANNLTGSSSSVDPMTQPGGVLGDLKLPPALEAEQASGTSGRALDFFRNMALNSSVVPAVSDTGARVYKASSPDEEALVKAAASYGICLEEREGNLITISVLGRQERYVVLQELEFNSDRKRMSVILRNRDTNALRLYIKGADDMVLKLLRADQDAATVQRQVDAYAESGLRTLVLGHRDLSEAEYSAWLTTFEEANADMQNRQARKEECYNRMEHDFLLVGATAIEDKLQKGVPETIQLLMRAGIKFWMCTGDKFSTALTISGTCNLKPKSYLLVTLEGEEDVEEVKKSVRTGLIQAAQAGFVARDSLPAGVRAGAETKFPGMTVILKGPTLASALDHCKAEFAQLTLAATSVVCCRVTPKQKAELVKIVKEAGNQTLAIGDGGNDVSMIQEAHVGVGIRGKEGLQASRAADYMVVPFMSLQRLILVHGRFSYYRTALVAQYSFYKSFYFCFLQIGYGFVSGFAGGSLFNSLCVAAYNALLFVPVVFFFVDKDISISAALNFPEAYKSCQRGLFINYYTMAWWFARAFIQAVITLSLALPLIPGALSAPYESFGLLVFMAYLTTQDFTMLSELNGVTLYNIVSVFGLHLVALIAGIIMNTMTNFGGLIDYYSFNQTLADPIFYWGTIMLTVAALLPIQAARIYVRMYGTPSFLSRQPAAAPNAVSGAPKSGPRSTSEPDHPKEGKGSVETPNPTHGHPDVVERRGSRVFYRNPTRSDSQRSRLSAASTHTAAARKIPVTTGSSVPVSPPHLP